MSGPCEMMVWCSPPRLKLMLPMVLLVVFTNAVSLHGNTVTAVNHNLQCVSDYESLINCSLNIAPSPNSSESNSSYWLTVVETNERERYVCMLVKNGADYFCSVQISNPLTDSDFESNEFLEQDIFEISLCHDQNDGVENCDLLTGKFMPFKNIKPNPPCCLTLSHQSGQHLFTWESTYEKYSLITTMAEELMFQLHFYKRGDEFSTISQRIINTDITNYSVADDKFLSDTEYCARVRSGPNQEYFEGQWSSWSSEIYWRTKPDVNVNTFMSGLGKKVFIPLSVMVLLALLLCYGPIKKWRQSSFIPTPAPYFHTLYSDCHGDFKSWVVTQENTSDMLEVKETLQIDTLTKCAVVQEEKVKEEEERSQPPCQQHFIEGSTYSNIINPGCDTSLLGVPYAVSTMSPLSDPGGSRKSLTFSSPPGSPTEGDSGCWLSSHTSLERDPHWYCNEYCTLTAFQQINPVTAMKSCTNREEQSGCQY